MLSRGPITTVGDIPAATLFRAPYTPTLVAMRTAPVAELWRLYYQRNIAKASKRVVQASMCILKAHQRCASYGGSSPACQVVYEVLFGLSWHNGINGRRRLRVSPCPGFQGLLIMPLSLEDIERNAAAYKKFRKH